MDGNETATSAPGAPWRFFLVLTALNERFIGGRKSLFFARNGKMPAQLVARPGVKTRN
jgi:hypothetical protein